MTVPDTDRCQAILKYCYRCRCTRRAHLEGLCRQHLATRSVLVPSEWRADCVMQTPIPPFRQWKG